MTEPWAMTAAAAARAIADGTLTAEALVRSCLERIAEREPSVAAWACLDPEVALVQARARDAAPRSGLLHGIPIGVKDIIDTVDLPTAYGSPIYRGSRPVLDAACVANAKLEGAVVLGKTVTTEFAFRYPGPTSNPHDRRYSPGGSSQGSAAAVTAGMVPLGIGTQTGGSVIRPSAYCGVYGFKPTFNALSFAGVRHFAESFDTLGVMARTLEDAALFRAALMRLPDPSVPDLGRAPRIALCRTPYWDEADPSSREAIEGAAAQLRKAGVTVGELSIRQDGPALVAATWTVNQFEGARTTGPDRFAHPDSVSKAVRELVDIGLGVPYERYAAALALIGEMTRDLHADLADYDALLTLSAPGEAPLGLDNTGPVTFNFLWTMAGTPAITLPLLKGAQGLPVGLQLVAARHREDLLLGTARTVERLLG